MLLKKNNKRLGDFSPMKKSAELEISVLETAEIACRMAEFESTKINVFSDAFWTEFKSKVCLFL